MSAMSAKNVNKGRTGGQSQAPTTGPGGLMSRIGAAGRRLVGRGAKDAEGHDAQNAVLEPGHQPGFDAQETALAPGDGPRREAAATRAPSDRPQREVTGGDGEQADAEAGPAYFSQRDNTAPYNSGDVQCSPTSFAMQLVNVYGGDVEAVKTRARAILVDRGVKADYEQVEDLLIEILQTTDWKAATAEKPSFFWGAKGWAAWAKTTYGGVYYKDPNAQQYVASLFDGVGNSGHETYAGLYTYAAWAPVIAALGEGAAVTTEGKFTASGHVVSVVSADASGVVINDPYGLYVEEGYYLRNGEAPRSSLGSSGMAVLKQRSALRSDVLPAYEATVALPNWGEMNTYTWAEIEKIQVGKWFSVIRGK